MTLERHLDLDTLSDELGRLGVYGMARVLPGHVSWLETAGVAVQAETAGCLQVTSRWLAAAVPARDAIDLLRKTLIRDSAYRLHLDLVMASVLHAVGASGRWVRLEELLSGPCHAFAPRFVSLLEWASLRTGKPGSALEPEDWVDLEPGDDDWRARVDDWDQRLWGFSGAAGALFPLLQDLYCPLLGQPSVPSSGSLESERRMLAELAAHAHGSAGIALHTDDARGVALSLIDKGLPVYVMKDGGTEKVVLVGAVESVGESLAETAEEAYVDAMSVVAKKSRLWVREAAEPYGDFWALENGDQIEAFVSLDADTATWPAEKMDGVPDSAQLPRAELLRGLSSSKESVEALRMLCGHAFFGFYVQLLLLEALDRELGQESLILVPELRMKVEEEDIEASTRVFYRPLASGEGSEADRPTAELGALDTSLEQVAKATGLQRLHTPYRLTGGVWSLGIRVMRSVELVRARADRWALSEHVVDRLHSGGLMTDVIRRGKAFRERLHEIFSETWSQRLAAKQEVPHG